MYTMIAVPADRLAKPAQLCVALCPSSLSIYHLVRVRVVQTGQLHEVSYLHKTIFQNVLLEAISYIMLLRGRE